MSYFTKEFLDFFKELNKNNNKKWFDANRKRYEEHVREPFKEFVNVMIVHIKEIEPGLDIEAKDAMFRINRDIRFSKDKTPYKTSVSANIQKGGKKSENQTGFYLHFSHDKSYIGGGSHNADKDGLYRIRSKIAGSLKEFNKLV